MPTPTLAEIDQQAAKLRDQAAALNRGQADRQERNDAEFGTKIDDAQRGAVSARAAANSATARATELHDRAKEHSRVAKEFEDTAASNIASGDPFAAELADDLREQAQLLRAERSERVAREELDRAERYDREATQLEQARSDRSDALDGMRHTANQLEDKAFALEEAARNLREADDRFEPADRDRLVREAEAAMAKADAIKPDFSRIETDALIEAGIPLSLVPGNELMAPTTQSSATGASLDSPAGDDVAGSFDPPAADDPIETIDDAAVVTDSVAADTEATNDVAAHATDVAADPIPELASIGSNGDAPDDFATDDSVEISTSDDMALEFES